MITRRRAIEVHLTDGDVYTIGFESFRARAKASIDLQSALGRAEDALKTAAGSEEQLVAYHDSAADVAGIVSAQIEYVMCGDVDATFEDFGDRTWDQLDTSDRSEVSAENPAILIWPLLPHLVGGASVEEVKKSQPRPRVVLASSSVNTQSRRRRPTTSR